MVSEAVLRQAPRAGLRKRLKRTVLGWARELGLMRAFARSSWRQRRLLILCYHGIAIEREHEWRPALFMHREEFEQRLELLQSGGYQVLPLDDGVARLSRGELPERAVVITFDDGSYDFTSLALPLLQRYAFPATVYLTTYYAQRPLPIFHLACSYMLWKRQPATVHLQPITGQALTVPAGAEHGGMRVVRHLVDFARQNRLSSEARDDLAVRLAREIGEDYAALKERRVLTLMQPAEVAAAFRSGIDIQLHTHRHRSPVTESLYRQEIVQNRDSIQHMTGMRPQHFCYPSGVHRPEFFDWLRKEEVQTAVTCDPGIATSSTPSLLLPRLVDHRGLSVVEFESWLSGLSDWLPHRQGTASVPEE